MRTPKAVREHQLKASRRTRVLAAAVEYADAIDNLEDNLVLADHDKSRELISAAESSTRALERAAMAWAAVARKGRRRRRRRK